MLLPFVLLLIIPIGYVECQLHDMEMTTQPSWAPTGRLNQFNGFATPRPSLLPANAQMVYASVWAAWSAWSFCSDSKRIRVRACNTVRGFRCLGPNQETEACDPSTSPILGRPPRPNTINSDDYDTVDPWQEDRVEALKQLYPDESIDEKLSHLPDHEKEKLRARLLPPPTQMSHELLNRPGNERDGAPGATPERLFGARPKALGARTHSSRAHAVPQAGQEALKFPELLNDDEFFSDITNQEKTVAQNQNLNQNQKLEDFSKIEDFQASVDAAENRQNLEEFEKLVEEHEIPRPPKNRGEGTFTAQKGGRKEEIQEVNEVSDEMQKLEETMDGPKFADEQFKEDVFGSIEELMRSEPKPTVAQTTTTAKVTVPTTTTTSTTTTTTTTTPRPTTTTTTTPRTTTPRRPPTRVTPRLPTVIPEDAVELVTPSMILKQKENRMNPEMVSFFEEEMMVEQQMTTRKPWKNAIHYGEVYPRLPQVLQTQAPPTAPPPPSTVPPTTTTKSTTTTSTTVVPTPSGFPIPEEISLDTLHALDWMLANMTKAAEEGGLGEGNELRLDSSSPNEPIPPSTKIVSKKPKSGKKSKKNRVKTHRTKIIQLHYGEVVPAEKADRKFPKFRNRNAHRAKIFGIKTSSIPEEQLKIQTKKEELVDEINDLRDLMEQMDERIESRSALMEESYDSLLKPKHEHDSPYRHRTVA